MSLDKEYVLKLKISIIRKDLCWQYWNYIIDITKLYFYKIFWMCETSWLRFHYKIIDDVIIVKLWNDLLAFLLFKLYMWFFHNFLKKNRRKKSNNKVKRMLALIYCLCIKSTIYRMSIKTSKELSDKMS